jgi:hypothetical protein
LHLSLSLSLSLCLGSFQPTTQADGTLGILGYNSNPKKLQLLIRKVFEEAVSNIKIQGSEVIPLPLFHVLDGKTTSDYCQRVEPSAQGGQKMANFILDHIESPIFASKIRSS